MKRDATEDPDGARRSLARGPRLPPLHDLLAFEAAARHLSFLRASEELHVTQSAVSHRIKSLEEALDVRLFIRVNRNIALTSFGERYLADVRDALARLAQATARIHEDTHERLRIAAAPALGAKWLITRLAEFQRAHPRVELAVTSSPDIDPVRSGKVDVAIRYGDDDAEGLVAVPLLRETLFPVAAPRFIDAHRIRQPGDLARVPLLRHPLLSWQRWFRAAGLDCDEPRSTPLFEDAMLMYEAVAAEQGVALTLKTVYDGFAESRRLARPFDIAVWDRSYTAVYAANAVSNPVVPVFIDWLREEAMRGQ